ncbi:MAG: hypothetical protein ACD_41C00287G0009 [uncultured bacterium]|nr:MAG: hypothetical protein ACD_41C00287G0009 [uncultured bacterium]HBY74114.1 hypothetical protein [Candidatus Kerfeldbacteria bacterium]
MKKPILIITLLTGLLITTTAEAFDCDTPTIQEAFDAADLVAVGTVITKEYQGSETEKKDNLAVVTLKLTQTWKGSATDNLTIDTYDARCGLLGCLGKTLKLDQEYLVYAEKTTDGRWELSDALCGRTRELAQADEDIENLDTVAREATIETFKLSLYNRIILLLPVHLFAVAAILVITILLLYIIIRTRKK